MKSFVISDNKDTWVGMRLVGIQGVIAHTKEEVMYNINEVLKDEEIGLIILTEKVVDLASEEILHIKLTKKIPLIIEIPDRHGTSRKENVLTQYIKESIGMSI
ncbi:MAG: ATP synthase subunit F [Epulopiscium sp. Nele67-Bin005]|nr:MAG: ATP synthase subunit F [Epulopiscium sp. Nele67-Bin005]